MGRPWMTSLPIQAPRTLLAAHASGFTLGECAFTLQYVVRDSDAEDRSQLELKASYKHISSGEGRCSGTYGSRSGLEALPGVSD
jgi:hypothetical protein